MTFAQAIAQAVALHNQGRLAEAEHIYQAVLRADGNNFDALHLLGVIRQQQGRHAEAVALIARALERNADNAGAHSNLGVALNSLGRYEEATTSCRRSLRIRPDSADGQFNLGNALYGLGRAEEAMACYREALTLRPAYADAHCNLGAVLKHFGRHDEAIACYRRALEIQPATPMASYNLGVALHDLGRHDEAIASYQRALALHPGHVDAHVNLGKVLGELNRHDEAMASYQRALTINPGFAEAHNNIGAVFKNLHRHADAIAAYQRALALKPDYADAYGNRGNALVDLSRHEEAVASFRQALALNPGYAEARVGWIHSSQHLCAWPQLMPECIRLREQVVNDGCGDVPPFSCLALPGIRIDEQYLCARQYAAKQYKARLARPPLHAGVTRTEGAKLRIGYLSPDFREHAVSYLLAEVFERHDRSRYAVSAYALGPADASAMRQRLRAGFDTFREIGALTHEAAAQVIAEDRIDILVDLSGYTMNSGLPITALRPAPVQVSWLGYPGTLGDARLADYLIGDAVVSPLTHAAHFSETLALMPNCFQPSDRQRVMGATPARAAAGLPAQGFVFCCFNQSYKIAPAVFDLWCRLLAQVPGSVLWLLGVSDAVRGNLAREAQQRGVAPERLIYAPQVDYAGHLARYPLADLFLDTLPFNAGATANDALWAGVPLVTCIGDAYAGRMAASLLNAAGLPELITETPEAYYRLALALATGPDQLAKIRNKLAANRTNCALFDSERFTRDLERLFGRMWTDYRAGKRQPIVLGSDGVL